MLKSIAILSLSLAVSLPSYSASMKTDWKEVGDSKAYLFEDTGLEWLSLEETVGMSIDDVVSQLDTTYSGWRLPTRQEVNEMFREIIDYNQPEIVFNDGYTEIRQTGTGKYNFALKSAKVYQYILGVTSTEGTYNTNSYTWKANGIYLNDEIDTIGGTNVLTSVSIDASGFLGHLTKDQNFSSDTSYSELYSGVFLVSDGGTTLDSINDPSLNTNNPNAPINQASVPLPSSGLLLGLVMAGFGFSRKISNCRV